jgi:hypothetical protein
MQDMRREQPVVPISHARDRARRRMRALAAAAQTAAFAASHPDAIHPTITAEPPVGGRAWLNGVELGGVDRRYDHLTRAHE